MAPGKVTGFLGPNGAGKSTTMRLILGLDAPDAGTAMVGRRPYRALRRPLFEVGAMLEAAAVHPGRSARGHLLALAAANAIARRRVDEVLALVGLEDVGGRRAGEFSLGMRQRLGIATALLGDPHVLVLDEPVNGLDPKFAPPGQLPPWTGFALFCAYAAAVLTAAAITLNRRDT